LPRREKRGSRLPGLRSLVRFLLGGYKSRNTVVIDAHAMVECLYSKLFLCIFVDGFHEGRVWQLDRGYGDGLRGAGSLRLLEEILYFPRDSCPSVFLDCGVTHCEVSIL
jgi:hypothetical protein